MRYRALSAIEHDGVRYEPGAAIDLTPEAARSLLEVGALEEAREPVRAAEERAGAIAAAARRLSAFRRSAEPPARSLLALVARADKVTKAERAAAWAAAEFGEGADPEGGSEAASGDPPQRGDDPAAGSDPAAGDPDRDHAIAAAIDRLDRADPDLWTADGKPRVEALEAAGGPANLTAADRDRVWTDLQP